MTLEEARQLKPGDRVLVEILIDYDSVFDEYGNVCLESAYVLPEAIREKIAPPRRKFKKGDIVAVKSGAIFYIAKDEQEGMRVFLAAVDGKTWDICLDASNLTLICAAEDRFHANTPNFFISARSFSRFPGSMGVRGSRS